MSSHLVWRPPASYRLYRNSLSLMGQILSFVSICRIQWNPWETTCLEGTNISGRECHTSTSVRNISLFKTGGLWSCFPYFLANGLLFQDRLHCTMPAALHHVYIHTRVIFNTPNTFIHFIIWFTWTYKRFSLEHFTCYQNKILLLNWKRTSFASKLIQNVTLEICQTAESLIKREKCLC